MCRVPQLDDQGARAPARVGPRRSQCRASVGPVRVAVRGTPAGATTRTSGPRQGPGRSGPKRRRSRPTPVATSLGASRASVEADLIAHGMAESELAFPIGKDDLPGCSTDWPGPETVRCRRPRRTAPGCRRDAPIRPRGCTRPAPRSRRGVQAAEMACFLEDRHQPEGVGVERADLLETVWGDVDRDVVQDGPLRSVRCRASPVGNGPWRPPWRCRLGGVDGDQRTDAQRARCGPQHPRVTGCFHMAGMAGAQAASKRDAASSVGQSQDTSMSGAASPARSTGECSPLHRLSSTAPALEARGEQHPH